MTFQKVEIGTWKPQQENDEIIGTLVKVEDEVGANKSMLYHLDSDGKPIAVWGSVVLDTKMTAVKVGQKIKIVFLGKGEAQKGQNPPKLFDVYIDNEKTVEEQIAAL